MIKQVFPNNPNILTIILVIDIKRRMFPHDGHIPHTQKLSQSKDLPDYPVTSKYLQPEAQLLL